MEGTSEKNDEDRKETFSSFSGGDHLRLQCKKEPAQVKPVRVDCYRMWLYAYERYSEDEEYITRLYEAISQMKLGEKTEARVYDYSDAIEFTFSDGSKERYIFEAGMYVDEQQNHYAVAEGIERIRSILNELMAKK